MPCTQRKARILVKEGKAKIVDYTPFTIQLTYATGEASQRTKVAGDTGSKYIGIAIISGCRIFLKGTIELRQDISKLLKTRREYRRGRRHRKTRYRQPRFSNRSRGDGWLPPSIQSRINSLVFWLEKFASLVPDPEIIIELGKFDIQAIMNPGISGKEYQEGNTYGFHNTRYYVFARDDYTCQICKKKGKILQTHHIIQKKDGGSDRADNLATVCLECHKKFHNDEISHKFRKPKQYKEGAFMNAIRNQVINRLDCAVTYGSITKVKRQKLGLEKTHYNDAVAITGIQDIKEDTHPFYLKQFRKKKRSLHEATARKGRKEPNREAKRNAKNTKHANGLFLNDKVSAFGKEGWITGFTNGGIRVKDVNNNYITRPGKSYTQIRHKDVSFICHNNNWQYVPYQRPEDAKS